MSRLPIPHIINTIKTKLGFDRTMTAPGEDVVDAVNKQSQQIDNVKAAAAYVEDGDVASQTYTEGQFVLWKGSLYTVKTGGMPQGEPISTTTYLDDVTGGGLNALYEQRAKVVFKRILNFKVSTQSGSGMYYGEADVSDIIPTEYKIGAVSIGEWGGLSKLITPYINANKIGVMASESITIFNIQFVILLCRI